MQTDKNQFGPSDEVRGELRELILSRKIVSAVHRYQAIAKCGLVEAKRWVEQYLDEIVKDLWPKPEDTRQVRKLSPKRVYEVLDELCRCGGFCLPPADIDRLMNNPPTDIDEFAKAIWYAEGFGDPLLNWSLYKGVRRTVAEHFQRAE